MRSDVLRVGSRKSVAQGPRFRVGAGAEWLRRGLHRTRVGVARNTALALIRMKQAKKELNKKEGLRNQRGEEKGRDSTEYLAYLRLQLKRFCRTYPTRAAITIGSHCKVQVLCMRGGDDRALWRVRKACDSPHSPAIGSFGAGFNQ